MLARRSLLFYSVEGATNRGSRKAGFETVALSLRRNGSVKGATNRGSRKAGSETVAAKRDSRPLPLFFVSVTLM